MKGIYQGFLMVLLGMFWLAFGFPSGSISGEELDLPGIEFEMEKPFEEPTPKEKLPTKESKATESTPLLDSILSGEDAPVEENATAEKDAPTEENVPAKEDAPAEKNVPEKEDAPTEENAPAEKTAPRFERVGIAADQLRHLHFRKFLCWQYFSFLIG